MKSKKILVGFLSLLLVSFVALGGMYAYYVNALGPVTKESNEVNFTIESGETLSEVLSDLAALGVIKNESFAKIYIRLSKTHEIKAGNFILDTSWGTKKVMEVLNDSLQAGVEQIYITIPEGKWAKDIAQLMEENTNVKAEELLTLWNDESYIATLSEDYWFLTPEILNSQHVYLEGYLFPETYAFLKQTSAKAITRRLLDHTESILNQYREQIDENALSIHELMTLASIVQYEANTEKDMKKIAGVFFNRMNRGMKLQSSVTVCYALYEFKSWTDCETNSDLKSDYNTYYVQGLPPGPILNPGEQAIASVLNPTKSDYLYFMADVYGGGKVYYAKTYEQHLRNVHKYLY